MKKKSDARGQNPGTVAGGARGLSAVTVLHIDDDPNDTALVQAATHRAKVRFQLQSVADAEQATAYLDGRGRFANRKEYPMPALILLDLKMPRATGFEILRWIRSQSFLRQIPVVVLSGSELQDDVQKAYSLGADAYMVKPLGFDALVSLVQSLASIWLASPLFGQVRNPPAIVPPQMEI